MKLYLTNIKIRISKLLTALSIIFIIAGCNPTKYVPDGEALLKKNEIIIKSDDKDHSSAVSKNDVKPYIRQIPNKKIFGARFHLGIYNLSNIKKESLFQRWLRNIGEEPVIFDEMSSQKAKDQIKSYLASKGYFNSVVESTLKTEKKETTVLYSINPGQPYKIRNVSYEIGDSAIFRLIMMDTINSLVESGQVYDVDQLQQERLRLERFVKNIGFYDFSSEEIFFKVDSALSSHQVDIYYNVSPKTSLDTAGNLVYTPHRLYRVRNVYVFPDFDPKEALRQGNNYMSAFDTLVYQNFNFISAPGRQYIKPGVIKQSIYVMPGSLYNLTNTEQSHSHLTALKNHRLVNIGYIEDEGTEGAGGEGTLDCVVKMTPMDRQAYTIELEGTNSAGNLGGAINLIYQNKNLLHGAEYFSLKFKGAYETLTESFRVRGFKSSQEFGVETSLQLPKFLVPFLSRENFIRKHDPKTVLHLGYNYQKLPVYTRTVANLSIGYFWKGNKYTSYTLTPLIFDVVNLPYIDPGFQAKVDTTTYLAFSYKDMMIVGGNMTYLFNNQNIQKSRDYWRVRLSFDAAGNLLSLGYKAAGAEKNDTTNYKLFGQDFAQYVKGEADISYHRKLNEASSVVYRVMAGVGWPYGNSKAMPFNEQYFGGGANDIRAWTVRTLGPGSYVLSESMFINQTADIKLEANAEYRFKLFWILEGAMFADAGNIWTFREDVDRPGAQFKFNKFLDDFAVGVGFGLRYDLKFVLLRTDLGLKLRDPQITQGSKLIPLSRPYDLSNDMAFVIGIGYPF